MIIVFLNVVSFFKLTVNIRVNATGCAYTSEMASKSQLIAFTSTLGETRYRQVSKMMPLSKPIGFVPHIQTCPAT